MNPSGKKEAVVISCLTTEVVRVVEPVKFYGAARAYIITCHNDGSEEVAEFHDAFLKEACEEIESFRGTNVTIEYANILDYKDVLKTIVGIVSEERARDPSSIIYVNISSGTPEYIAGAMLAVTQNEELIAFSVSTKTGTLDLEQKMKAYSVDGKPVGRTSAVNDPIKIMTFGAKAPDDKLVACLEVFRSQEIEKKYYNFNEIIDALKSKGTWDYMPDGNKTKTEDAQKERMYLRRNYITPLIERGWVVENLQKRNKFDITSKGKAVVSVYGKE